MVLAMVVQFSIRCFGRIEREQANCEELGITTWKWPTLTIRSRLWVNGTVLQFDKSTAYDLADYRSEKDRRPHWTATDPLDASPAVSVASRLP